MVVTFNLYYPSGLMTTVSIVSIAPDMCLEALAKLWQIELVVKLFCRDVIRNRITDFDHLVDDPVCFGFVRTHEEVAF